MSLGKDLAEFLITVFQAFSKWFKRKPKTNNIDFDVLASMRLTLELGEMIADLFQDTKVTRSVMLVLINGKTDFRTTTVVFSHHAVSRQVQFSIGPVGSYSNMEIDDYYRVMVKSVEQNGISRQSRSNMPDCMLKSIYESEGVNHSNIYLIHRFQDFDGKGNDAVLIKSIGTHYEDGFTNVEELRIKIVVDWIKSKYIPGIKISPK